MSIRLHEYHTTESDPARRGRDIGERFATQIADAWSDYELLFDLKGLRPAEAQEFSETTLARVADWAPALHTELLAMAAGAERPAWQLAALTARTELLAQAGAQSSECTTVVHVPADGAAPRTLQTWDWLEALAGEGLLAEHPGADGRMLRYFTEFGTLGKIGVSEAGIGVHFNILHHASDGGAAGIPLHLLVRHVLETASSVAEAVAIVEAAPVSASSTITVASFRDGVADAAILEVCPAGVAVLPIAPGETLAHANSFLDPALAVGDSTPEWSNSRDRQAFFARNARAVQVPDALSRARGLATDPSTGERSVVCLFPDPAGALDMRWESKLTITLELATPHLEYAIGAPSAARQDNWHRFP
jgi:isopenicillin-N N-acyltransferase-like protein